MDLRPVIQKELVCLFLTEEAYSHGSLQTRELGQTPLYRRNLNGLGLKFVLFNRPDPVLVHSCSHDTHAQTPLRKARQV